MMGTHFDGQEFLPGSAVTGPFAEPGEMICGMLE
jgi:hypothetical protein